MYSKFISIAFVFAATLSSTGAVAFPRDNDKHHSPSSCATSTWQDGQSQWHSAPCPTPTSQHHEGRDGKPMATPTPTATPTPMTTPTPTTTSTPTTTQVTTTQVTTTQSATTQSTTTNTGTPIKTTDTAKPSDTDKHDGKPTQPAAANSVSCDGFQPWQANLAYSAGAQVIFNNQLWTAKQWSYSNNPESAAAEWTQNGCCKQPVSNKVDCTGVPAWNKGAAYSGGAKVTFNGHLWISTQWTSSNQPGDTSGTWKDLGACN